jgi:hypothetical protein
MMYLDTVTETNAVSEKLARGQPARGVPYVAIVQICAQ